LASPAQATRNPPKRVFPSAKPALSLLYVRSLLALRTGGDFEADLLAFLVRPEALHGDGRKMREQIIAAAVRAIEAVAFGVVESRDGASCHFVSL
jgi:hypothetical protein